MKISQAARARFSTKLAGRINFAGVLGMPEKNFHEVIRETENSDLFKKLANPENSGNKTVKQRKFPFSGLSSSHFMLNENVFRGEKTPQIESLLEEHGDVVEKIKAIGAEKFKKYFLYNEGNFTEAEITRECGLSPKDVWKINKLMVYTAIQSEFYQPAGYNGGVNRKYYSKIATIEKISGNKLLIGYFSPNHAKGRYIIDYSKISGLKAKGYFTPEEKKQLNNLLSKLEMINTRKKILYFIILKIIKKQREYLAKNDLMRLKPYAQKELAKELRIDPSLVSRALLNKSLETPSGEEVSLKTFFPSRKMIAKIYIKDIMEEAGGRITDKMAAERLRQKWNISVSRRSISDYRREVSKHGVN